MNRIWNEVGKNFGNNVIIVKNVNWDRDYCEASYKQSDYV